VDSVDQRQPTQLRPEALTSRSVRSRGPRGNDDPISASARVSQAVDLDRVLRRPSVIAEQYDREEAGAPSTRP